MLTGSLARCCGLRECEVIGGFPASSMERLRWSCASLCMLRCCRTLVRAGRILHWTCCKGAWSSARRVATPAGNSHWAIWVWFELVATRPLRPISMQCCSRQQNVWSRDDCVPGGIGLAARAAPKSANPSEYVLMFHPVQLCGHFCVVLSTQRTLATTGRLLRPCGAEFDPLGWTRLGPAPAVRATRAAHRRARYITIPAPAASAMLLRRGRSSTGLAHSGLRATSSL